MKSVVSQVAVVGSGISGAVCVSSLFKNGVSVTIFESARGPSGRMSQRREVAEDGKELVFDHGASYFSVSNAEVLGLVREWESRGLVAEWKENFRSFDCISNKFVDIQQEGLTKKYVGVPGMNAICRVLCHEPGVDSKFGVGVGRLEWLVDENLWSLVGLDGQNLGRFRGGCIRQKYSIAEVYKCNRTTTTSCEWWILHSTTEYANSIIAQTGLLKPSKATLTRVAEELFQEFQSTGLNIRLPFFKKARRWSVPSLKF